MRKGTISLGKKIGNKKNEDFISICRIDEQIASNEVFTGSVDQKILLLVIGSVSNFKLASRFVFEN